MLSMSDTPLGRGAKVFLNVPIFLQTLEDQIYSKFQISSKISHTIFMCNVDENP